jgi:hypothetical protein
MEAQYKLKYALQNLRENPNEQISGKVTEILNKEGRLDAENEEIFNSVSSYIDDVDAQSKMLYKELGPYRFFNGLNGDSAKVSAFSESVELICGLAPEKVPEMLRLVEKISNTSPDAQTTIDSNGCILVKKVMKRILPPERIQPQGQILPERQ